MFKVPLRATPSQSLVINLGGQQCEIVISEKYPGGVFLSLRVNNVQVLTSMVCRDRVSLVRFAYRGFKGTLSFIDTQGRTDPTYTGFGTRYQLAYIP